MDYLDVIVHIFTPEAREFYRLEQLWGEAPKRDRSNEKGRPVGRPLIKWSQPGSNPRPRDCQSRALPAEL